jgi:predicted transcriptional regulator
MNDRRAVRVSGEGMGTRDMEERVELRTYGERLWTRDLARAIRARVRERLEALRPGDVLVLDAQGVEVFDFSFADELFGTTLVSLAHDHPGRFVLVEGLSTYTRENLAKALETLGLMMVERRQGTLQLIGKVHPTDQETFAALVQARGPVTAAALARQLGVRLNAMNERLAKLTAGGVLRRERRRSPAGRAHYEYHLLR